MMVNIAELNTGIGKEVSFAFEASADAMDAVSEGCTFEAPIVVRGKATNTGVCYRLEGTIACRKSFACDRCLEPCTEEQTVEFSEDFRRAGDGGSEDANVFEGDTVDITGMVRDTLLAAQPLSNICKPDCKGLCPVCGANLNHGDCGCERFVSDPRLAALQQWKKDFE